MNISVERRNSFLHDENEVEHMKIIGGSAKGTLLSSPAGRNTRPTLGRVRESVFNVLANVGILETKVLDILQVPEPWDWKP